MWTVVLGSEPTLISLIIFWLVAFAGAKWGQRNQVDPVHVDFGYGMARPDSSNINQQLFRELRLCSSFLCLRLVSYPFEVLSRFI